MTGEVGGSDDDDLLDDVLAATGVTRRGPMRPRHGWSNQAWIGETEVVRISSGRLPGSLVHEAEVAARLARRGYPVAEVLGVGDLASLRPAAHVDAQWLVSRRLPGVTLAEAWPALDARRRQRAGRELGGWLRTLHDQTDQNDLADVAPVWWRQALEPSHFHNAYRPPVAMARVMAEAAADLPHADTALLAEIVSFVDQRLAWFATDDGAARRVFAHTDVHGHNVLVDPTTGAVTGILDWEGAHTATADVELDLLLRWSHAADSFPERPGAPCAIAPGDAEELVDHVLAGYPELGATPVSALASSSTRSSGSSSNCSSRRTGAASAAVIPTSCRRTGRTCERCSAGPPGASPGGDGPPRPRTRGAAALSPPA